MDNKASAGAAAARHHGFDGTLNFRDIGGYTGADGRTVKWGRIYRSDALSKLTDSDQQRIRELEIRTICDFRSTAEQERHPNRLASEDPPRLLDFAVIPNGYWSLLESIQEGRSSPEESHGYMVDSYREYARNHRPQFSALLHHIHEADNLPVVIHCHAGKDRTGFAIAMVLQALGVDEETVFEDYLLTNEFQGDPAQFVPKNVAAEIVVPMIEARQ